MSEPNNNVNSWETKDVNQSGPADQLGAPPPPPEVKIRTLRSDLESVAESGGGMPKFQSIKMPGFSQEPTARGKRGKSDLSTALIVFLAVGLVVAVVYLVYKLFYSGSAVNEPVTPNNPTSSVSLGLSAYNPPPPPQPAPITMGTVAGSFVHHSLFRKPVDKVLTLIFNGTAASASDLQTYNQRLVNLLSGASLISSFFEIDVKNSNSYDMEANEIFSFADIAVLDTQYISAHFASDATVFVYKDKAGSWPGYILPLKQTENWLFLKDDIAKLEKSSKLTNFFLAPPGGAAAAFKDGTVNDQPVRILNFAAPSSSFIYGWLRGNLIMSTSEEGLKQALSRL